MTEIEVFLAVVFALGGVRSLLHWGRRPFESLDLRDQLLYAAFRASRIGTWFAFAGLFVIYATADGVDVGTRTQRFSWYLGLVLVLAAAQLVTSWILGHRTPERPPPEF